MLKREKITFLVSQENIPLLVVANFADRVLLEK